MSDIRVKPISETSHQCSTTNQHNIVVQVYLKIRVTLLNSIISNLCDTFELLLILILTVAGVEDNLGGTDTLFHINFDNVTVRQLI